jgi:hypothetical protein
MTKQSPHHVLSQLAKRPIAQEIASGYALAMT